ncbi:MAG TPA: helix-turn-helix domain-containing protein [Nitrospirota bacterium]|nr:helix-turn-helix domain-containing protein [Nitrospirota bacterium]
MKGAELPNCPVEQTIALLGSKWKLLILRELFKGTKRFGELSRGVPGISQKMLTQQLRQLEEDNLIQRKVYAEVPPRVEYSLTEIGKSLSPILDAMHKWGAKYIMQNGKPGSRKKRENDATAAKLSVA